MKNSRKAGSIPTLTGNVLVAEDQPEVRQLLIILLETAGMQVVAVENGEDLVKAALNAHFHVILTDIQMPKLSGVEATKKLRQQGIITPIIALTANAITQQNTLYQDVGFSDYIGKPFTRETFLTTIAKHIHALSSDVTRLEAEIQKEVNGLGAAFITSLHRHREAALLNLNAHNWRELASIAHAVAGSASTLGFTALGRAAQLLELSLMRMQHPNFSGEVSEQEAKAHTFIQELDNTLVEQHQEA